MAAQLPSERSERPLSRKTDWNCGGDANRLIRFVHLLGDFL